MMNCIVIDDEPYARKLLTEFIARLPNLTLEGSYSSALQSLEILKKKQIDILFLDIQMPDITGIEFLKTLDKKPNIIFTTAYAEFALEGFELDAIDYLLKPFDFQRFLKAVNKVAVRLDNGNLASNNVKAKTDSSEYLFVKDGNKLVKIDLKDVRYIKGLREYVTIHTSLKKIMSLQTLKNLEQELPSYFVRIHNSYIISVHAVQAIGRNEVEIDNEVLPIGITYKKTFFEKIRTFYPDKKLNDV